MKNCRVTAVSLRSAYEATISQGIEAFLLQQQPTALPYAVNPLCLNPDFVPFCNKQLLRYGFDWEQLELRHHVLDAHIEGGSRSQWIPFAYLSSFILNEKRVYGPHFVGLER